MEPRPARGAERASWLAGIYDATAWYWDSFLHALTYARAYRRLLARLEADGPHRAPPGRVLDCGIGAGLFSEAAIRAGGARAGAYGVDLSPRLLARASARLGRQGARPFLARADVRALPIRDAGMDAVISALVLDHLADPAPAIRELARVARPGAWVVLVTTRPLAPDLPFRLLFRYPRHRPDDLVRAMQAAGLKDVRVRSLTGIARIFAVAFTGRV
ncbi:class I SAM-dependent methyltransferase [Anaeromyxobacter dehalogenans]|uniref:Methyltransferase type 11 n=1 Tax=Anaeromyxobacter dehalogenans (strain 2CP-C) TaxID=290397 RepID=Q2IFL6_ANADE|nr:methyltransferase domain-containing protein [Anaeromyxobacter dehalogenans]ABC83373.1 Methyltransferase type 11 [Anaeromyxobacter dehalogenans 2CP-C]